jgi:hypothetical protein
LEVKIQVRVNGDAAAKGAEAAKVSIRFKLGRVSGLVGVHEYLMISQLTRELNFQDLEKSKRRKQKDSKITIEAA